jgi:hypothetical protein
MKKLAASALSPATGEVAAPSSPDGGEANQRAEHKTVASRTNHDHFIDPEERLRIAMSRQ